MEVKKKRVGKKKCHQKVKKKVCVKRDTALEVTSYQLPVTSYQLLLLLLSTINNSAKRIQNWG